MMGKAQRRRFVLSSNSRNVNDLQANFIVRLLPSTSNLSGKTVMQYRSSIALRMVGFCLVLSSFGFCVQLIRPKSQLLPSNTIIPRNGENPSKQEPRSLRKGQTKHGEATIHLVFSTGCSLWQDWQSLVFFYHVKKVGQVGNVTRIVSGCNGDQAQQLSDFHQQYVNNALSENFHVHFTPDYSTILPNVKYKYFNKPFGLKHWMEESLGYSSSSSASSSASLAILNNNTHDQDVIILLDPDQILLRPLTDDYSNVDMRWTADLGFHKRVQQGIVFAQQYGYRSDWLTDVNVAHVLQNETSSDEYSPSALWNIPSGLAVRFAAGPPYLATAKDMYKIVTYWTKFAPRVVESHPSLLAEMYAYTLASMHVRLPTFTAYGFMVSDTRLSANAFGEEGWYWIEDDLKGQRSTQKLQAVCGKSLPSGNRENTPFILHYCQTYNLGYVHFFKYALPDTFTKCDSPLLKEPSMEDLLHHDYAINPITNIRTDFGTATIDKQRRAFREAWMLCTLIPAINEAIAFHKQQYCPKNESTDFRRLGILW